MEPYPLLWGLHVLTAALSVTLFLWRFCLDELGRDWRHTPLRFVPHINDTVLLSAAVGLCLVAGWRPWVHGWLAAKVVLVLVYIVLGGLAFRQQRRNPARALSLAAIAVVGLITILALNKPALA